MVIMEKLRKTVFDTIDELGPEDGYRTKIDYAQRLTWGGEFIHAAPWSEGEQGTRNVSHGCVNVSMANGAWLFNQHQGRRPDHRQGHRAQAGRTATAGPTGTMSWEEYVKGSALPYEPAEPEAADEPAEDRPDRRDRPASDGLHPDPPEHPRRRSSLVAGAAASDVPAGRLRRPPPRRGSDQRGD